MTRTTHIVGLCLTAVFFMSAIAGGDASALPSFLALFECQELKGTSLWKVKMPVSDGNNCLVYDSTSLSNFEPVSTTGLPVEPEEKIPLTSTGGEKILTTAGGSKVECKKDQSTGEIIGSQHIFLTIRFEECKVTLGGECTTAGQEEGVILTKELKGWLYFIKKEEPKEAGIFLTTNTNLAPATFAEFECEIGTKVKVLSISTEEAETLNDKLSHSCLAGKIEPIDTLVGEGKLVFLKEGGKQAIKAVEYNEHEFECELETEITVGIIKTEERSWEEDVIPPGDPLTAAEPWELMTT